MLTHDADEWREKVRLVKKNYPVVKLRGNVARTRREPVFHQAFSALPIPRWRR
jgi:hypothetical protein